MPLDPNKPIDPADAVKTEHVGKPFDRITCLLTLHHESFQNSPVSVNCKFQAKCELQEQPYVRRLKVTKEGVAVDLNWLHDLHGLIVVENRAGRNLQVIPTPEEKELIDKSIIAVELCPGCVPLIVRPGQCAMFEPLETSGLRLRSFSDEVEFVDATIHVMPR